MKNNKGQKKLIILLTIAIVSFIAHIITCIQTGSSISWTFYTFVFATFTFEFADLAKKRKES